ncbi:MAG: hypothetical protein J6Q95_01370 [Alistipes sp.]|nr:hypothetical protein [Alistipes sp.]
MTCFDYVIAGLRLRSNIDLAACGLRGFRPFEVEVSGEEADCLLCLNRDMCIENYTEFEELTTSYLAEADADGCFMRGAEGYLYVVQPGKGDAAKMLFYIDRHTGVVETNVDTDSRMNVAILRFGIWVMFGVVLSMNNAIAIHSSVVVADGRAALFLGESGTGKSTHTRLWLENIKGAQLLNDDSPIIRVENGVARVYGSPWSGKTPCYKNEVYPIAALCRLEQAPHNVIRRLPTIFAIGAVLPSCPPIFAYDDKLQDMICSTLGDVLRVVAAYKLECLPDANAAQLSYKTIMTNG